MIKIIKVIIPSNDNSITMVLCKLNFFFIKVLKNKEKKLAQNSFYCPSQAMLLDDSKNVFDHDRIIKVLYFLTYGRIQKL